MRKSPRATLASWVLSKLPKCIHNLIKFFYNIAEKNGCFLINCKNSCNARQNNNKRFYWQVTNTPQSSLV